MLETESVWWITEHRFLTTANVWPPKVVTFVIFVSCHRANHENNNKGTNKQNIA